MLQNIFKPVSSIKLSLFIFIFTILATFNLNLIAANKYYQLELIVFKYNNTDDVYKEKWQLADLAIPADNINLLTNTNNLEYDNKYFKLLDSNNLIFKYIYNRIDNNSRYKVISHIGWRQPIDLEELKDHKNKLPPILIQTGVVYNYAEVTEDNKTDLDKTLDKLNHTYEITGVINFEYKKYLHANIKLLLNQPVKLNTGNNDKPFEIITDLESDYARNNQDDIILQGFTINETRRLINKKPNYLDHPLFGAILVAKEA